MYDKEMKTAIPRKFRVAIDWIADFGASELTTTTIGPTVGYRENASFVIKAKSSFRTNTSNNCTTRKHLRLIKCSLTTPRRHGSLIQQLL